MLCFSVWVLTGFACCTARKSRSTHAVFRKCSYTCCACSSSKNHIGQEDGRIAECGTHDELMARGGLYRRFTEIRERAELWQLDAE